MISHEACDKKRQRLTLPGVILVPSALAGLTALFGMGRGDPRRYSHLKVFKAQSLKLKAQSLSGFCISLFTFCF
jgi:hypothetical protein